MSSVLIKGIEIPQSCEDCHLESFCSLWVEARRISGWTPEKRNEAIRHPDCPLVSVPPHRRLIDADALKASLAFAEETAKWAVLMVIDKMPTIIPASEEDEK